MPYGAKITAFLSLIIPRKRAGVFLAIFVVLGLGVALYFGVKRGDDGEGNAARHDPDISGGRAAHIAALTRDEDADGLKDWEEAIFRTDPLVADTDADGTPDGEEVKQGRDSLNPNTSINPQKPNDFAAAPTLFPADDAFNPAPNVTEQFSRSILPDIMGPILAGKSPQSDDLTRKASNFDLLQRPERIWIGAKQYSAADIAAHPKNDLPAIVQMFLSISQTIVKYTGAPSDDQNTIINFIQNPASEDARASLLAYQNRLDGLIQDIRRIPVPQDYREFILSYLNTLSKMRYSLALIANLEDDPISALLAVKALPQAQEDFSATVARTQDESKKIVERKVKELTSIPKKLP